MSHTHSIRCVHTRLWKWFRKRIPLVFNNAMVSVRRCFDMIFRNRREAGRLLATRLSPYAGRSDVVVLALPRGGVPVAYEVARALHAPLDVFIVRKLGVPGHEELAMGAIASGGSYVLNEEAIYGLGIPEEIIHHVIVKERGELRRREKLYRDSRQMPYVRGQTIILVDDGLATGATMRAAVAALRQQQPARIVVAVPVGSAETCADLRHEADEAICALEPQDFHAVGVWYQDFSQTSDEEVRSLLAKSEREYSRQNGTSEFIQSVGSCM
jgi:predicted phosphoribosyltransferase